MCFTGRINTGNTKPLMSVFFQQKKMMVVMVSMQQKAVVGKPPEWFLQGGEIFITEFAYAGSRFARLCGFFWRLAHFFFCKDRWGFRLWSRYRLCFRVRLLAGGGFHPVSQKVYRKWPVACRSGEISAVCGLQKKTMELR